MSWLDKIKTDLTITCGDGTQFKFDWLNANKQREYNVSEFEFINVEGTYVHRKAAKGARYNIELYFQGENHLDFAQQFDDSAKDPRPWSLSHPFYGLLTVQPLSLSFDNTGLNLTKITGTVIETLPDEYPKGSAPPQEVITVQVATVDQLAAAGYANNVSPKAPDVAKMQQRNSTIYADASKYVTTEFAASYFNAFKTAQGAITQATDAPLTAIRTMQALISAPAQFASNVQSRLGVLQKSFDTMRSSIAGSLSNVTRADRYLYQNNAGTALTAMLQASATPFANEYRYRDAVVDVIEQLVNNYNTYLADLGTLQGSYGGDPDSFMPDAESITALNNLFNFAIYNLFQIANSGKQQRTHLVVYDTNWIILAHRFYGITQQTAPDGTATDTVQELIAQNGAGLNRLMQVPANTLVKYYV